MSYTGSLLNFINSSTSAYHAVITAQNYLLRNHFVNLNLSDDRIRIYATVCALLYRIRIFRV